MKNVIKEAEIDLFLFQFYTKQKKLITTLFKQDTRDTKTETN